MATERWKVLYLHGWRENADYSRNRCAPLIQALPSFDFDFISAPYRYKNSKRARTWWNATSANKTGPKTYVGMIDTLYYVADMIDRKLGTIRWNHWFQSGRSFINIDYGIDTISGICIRYIEIGSTQMDSKSIKFYIFICHFWRDSQRPICCTFVCGYPASKKRQIDHANVISVWKKKK
eukprot:1055340_1